MCSVSLPEQDRRNGFLRFAGPEKRPSWKATGGRAVLSPGIISMSPCCRERVRPLVEFTEGFLPKETAWTLISLNPDPAYAAALVVEGGE